MGQNFKAIVKEVLERCDDKEVEIFDMIAQRLWLRRNAVIHGEIFMEPNKLFRLAIEAVEEFHKAQEEGKIDSLRDPQTEALQVVEKWSPPPGDFVKMNWDAATDISQGRIGLGCVARSSNGCFLAARSRTSKARAEPAVVEALAAAQAVAFAREMGFRQIIFERDALKIVNDVNSEGPCTSTHGHFVKGIQAEMQAFEKVYFNYVRRDANNAAHWIA